MRTTALLIAVAALTACSANAPPADTTTMAVPATPAVTPLPSAEPAIETTTATPAAQGTAPAFVGTAWKVTDSAGGQAGTIYTFAKDGSLVIDAPGGTPTTGRWAYTDGKLTMVEDGIAYPTDIVSLDDAHFVIRSHNPGGTVDIAMVAASARPQVR